MISVEKELKICGNFDFIHSLKIMTISKLAKKHKIYVKCGVESL